MMVCCFSHSLKPPDMNTARSPVASLQLLSVFFLPWLFDGRHNNDLLPFDILLHFLTLTNGISCLANTTWGRGCMSSGGGGWEGGFFLPLDRLPSHFQSKQQANRSPGPAAPQLSMAYTLCMCVSAVQEGRGLGGRLPYPPRSPPPTSPATGTRQEVPGPCRRAFASQLFRNAEAMFLRPEASDSHTESSTPP